MSARLWSCWYRVGSAGDLRYFSALAQPARECPAADHPGAEMHLGALVVGEFVVLEIRRVQGGRWRSAWRDDTSPFGRMTCTFGM